MPVVAKLPDPESTLLALPQVETVLRAQYLVIEQPAATIEPVSAADGLLEDSAALLELVLVTACAVELLSEQRATSRATTVDSVQHFWVRVRQVSGLDPVKVVNHAIRHLRVRWPDQSVPSLRPTIQAVIRTVRSLLEACPITALEQRSRALGLGDLGYRCRLAYDALEGFVLRNDPREKSRLRVVGREYAAGNLSISDAATLLESDVPDAVALLERCGYHRTLDVIELKPAERADRLTRIRADRLHRAGQPAAPADAVARDVIASERIEGVDARHWMRSGAA